MKVILLKEVPKVGRKFEVKDIADGFAMNSLIPRGLAEPATSQALKSLEKKIVQEADARKVRDDLVEKNLEGVGGVTVEITGKGNEQGHLFASIHKEDLALEIKRQTRLDIEADHIILERPLKEAGEHAVKIKVGDKEVEIKVIVKIL